MARWSCLLAITLFTFLNAYASGGANSIGTVSARGNVRVDGYTVQGNGTLFDGTTLETGQTIATLRLNNGTEIKLGINSHGVVHRDRLVLLQGESQLKAVRSPFFLEADGLRVAPSGPDALGVVSLSAANTVDVAAVTGEFRILDNAGLSLAHVSQGTAMSFHQAEDPGQAIAASVTEIGLVSYNKGYYYLTTNNGMYLLVGDNLEDFVGAKVIVVGTIQAATTPSGTSQIAVTSIEINGPTSMSNLKKALIGTAIAGGSAGIGVAIYENTKPPASR